MLRSHLTGPFATFLDEMDATVSLAADEPTLLARAEASLSHLLRDPSWLPLEYQRDDAEKYQQHALYVDAAQRYSVVSFVWAPGQATPVHNHTVWGLIGVLVGAESCEEFDASATGMRTCHTHLLGQGEIDRVSPTIGDVHRVRNAFDDRVTISIHVYGGDIGRISRNVFEADGTARAFVSGYSNAQPWIAAVGGSR